MSTTQTTTTHTVIAYYSRGAKFHSTAACATGRTTVATATIITAAVASKHACKRCAPNTPFATATADNIQAAAASVGKIMRSLHGRRYSDAKYARMQADDIERLTETAAKLAATNRTETQPEETNTVTPAPTTIPQLAADLKAACTPTLRDQHPALFGAAADAAYRLSATSEQFHRAAIAITDGASDAVAKLEMGRTLNSRGELQGRAFELDRLCAVLTAEERHAAALLAIIRSLDTSAAAQH